MSHILWVATADARGHLMRGQLLCTELMRRDHELQLVTTSTEGQDFLATFGLASGLLSEHFRVEFDAHQNMSRGRTEARILRYLLSPHRLHRDLRWLAAQARNADLLVCDSLHPALIVAPALGIPLPPMVHIYGENLRAALEDNVAWRLPAPVADWFRDQVGALIDQAYGGIVHGLSAPLHGRALRPGWSHLPPVVALPLRSRDEVRSKSVV